MRLHKIPDTALTPDTLRHNEQVTPSLLTAARWFVVLVYVRLLFGAARTFRKAGHGLGSIPLAATIWILLVQSQRTELYIPLALPAAILLIASLVLFQWASQSIRGLFFSYLGDPDTPQFLFQKGPYAHIRNPFYTSYLLANTGVAMAFPSWITAAAALASLVVLWMAALYEERKFARSGLAEEYRAYRSRTGRFLPKI